MPMNETFDASVVPPNQGGQSHPVGKKFPFTITKTIIEPNKNNDGGFLKVEFTTQAGVAYMRYNLWNQNQKAMDIARGQLSALCHATGVYKLSFENDGAALVNARGMIDVDQQVDDKGQPTQYTQITRVYDAQGNEPGKGSSAPQPQAQQGSWGGNGQQANPGWTNQAPAPQVVQQQPPPNPAPAAGASGGWQQGNAPANNPPWRS